MCATSKHQLDHYPWNQTRSDACTGWRRILVVSYLTSNLCRSIALFLRALQFQIHWIQRDMDGFTLDFMFNIKWVLVHHIFSIVSALPSLDWITTNGLKLNLCVWLFWTLTPAPWMPEFSLLGDNPEQQWLTHLMWGNSNLLSFYIALDSRSDKRRHTKPLARSSFKADWQGLAVKYHLYADKKLTKIIH